MTINHAEQADYLATVDPDRRRAEIIWLSKHMDKPDVLNIMSIYANGKHNDADALTRFARTMCGDSA